MRLRKLLLAAGAIMTAGALALTPVAQANNPNGANIATIVVGGNAGNNAYPTNLTMKFGQLQTNVFGVPTIVNCGAGNGIGTINGGITGIAPLAGEVIAAINLNCPSFLPGTVLNVAVTCPIEVVYVDPNVHVGLVDAGVPGNAKFSAVDGTIHLTSRANPLVHCLRVTISNGCTFFVGGSTAVQFDEAVKVVGGQNQQDLHILGGPGLLVKNPNAACLGGFPNNTPFRIAAIFNHNLAAGTVDFQ